jgi:hypothetical protein
MFAARFPELYTSGQSIQNINPNGLKKTILRLIILFLIIPCLAQAQDKYPPRDDSAKSPELQSFVSELKQIIKNKDSEKLLARIHPRVRFDFDEGVGIQNFKERWQPDNRNSKVWDIMDKIVGLGGVFVKNRTDLFYDFVFPYVNEVDLKDADQYFNVLVVTGKDVRVREKPDWKSAIIGHLTYDVVNFDYEKSSMGEWYYVETSDKKISGYVSSDFVYSPVDFRMFLTKKKGRWMISCLIAGD